MGAHEKKNRVSPLLAIDDFGIQLDVERHNQLKEQIAHFGQVFLTSPHPMSPLTGDIAFQAFHVQQGNLLS